MHKCDEMKRMSCENVSLKAWRSMPELYSTSFANNANTKRPMPTGVCEKWLFLFRKRSKKPLGFSIVGGTDSPKGRMGIYVKTINPKGLVGEAHLLRQGDEIVEVNGIPMKGLTRSAALQAFRNDNVSYLAMLIRRRGRVETCHYCKSTDRKLAHPNCTVGRANFCQLIVGKENFHLQSKKMKSKPSEMKICHSTIDGHKMIWSYGQSGKTLSTIFQNAKVFKKHHLTKTDTKLAQSGRDKLELSLKNNADWSVNIGNNNENYLKNKSQEKFEKSGNSNVATPEAVAEAKQCSLVDNAKLTTDKKVEVDEQCKRPTNKYRDLSSVPKRALRFRDNGVEKDKNFIHQFNENRQMFFNTFAMLKSINNDRRATIGEKSEISERSKHSSSQSSTNTQEEENVRKASFGNVKEIIKKWETVTENKKMELNPTKLECNLDFSKPSKKSTDGGAKLHNQRTNEKSLSFHGQVGLEEKQGVIEITSIKIQMGDKVIRMQEASSSTLTR